MRILIKGAQIFETIPTFLYTIPIVIKSRKHTKTVKLARVCCFRICELVSTCARIILHLKSIGENPWKRYHTCRKQPLFKAASYFHL